MKTIVAPQANGFEEARRVHVKGPVGGDIAVIQRRDDGAQTTMVVAKLWKVPGRHSGDV